MAIVMDYFVIPGLVMLVLTLEYYVSLESYNWKIKIPSEIH